MPHSMTGSADASPILIRATLLCVGSSDEEVVEVAAVAAAAAAAAALRAIDSGGVEKCEDEEREAK